MKKERKTRKQFEFLNVKLLHNQNPQNYVKLFCDLVEADFVIDTKKGRQLELLEFGESNYSGVYVGKIVSYMKDGIHKWYDKMKKEEVAGPDVSDSIHPDYKQAYFFLVPERHRIALASSSDIPMAGLKQFVDEASCRLLGNMQLSSSIETDRKYIEDIKNAKEVSRIEVTWSYTNKDFNEGLSKVLDKGAIDGNAAQITTIITSAPGESLTVNDDSLPGAVLNLAMSNATSEAEATIRNPEYNKNGRRIKVNRFNVSTSNYTHKAMIAFGAAGLAFAIYEYVMRQFKQG